MSCEFSKWYLLIFFKKNTRKYTLVLRSYLKQCVELVYLRGYASTFFQMYVVDEWGKEAWPQRESKAGGKNLSFPGPTPVTQALASVILVPIACSLGVVLHSWSASVSSFTCF